MTNFTIQAGSPWPTNPEAEYQRIRVTLPTGRTYWLEDDEFEVLMQVRAGASETSELKADLAQYLTVSMDGADDILIDWAMTGADTRTLEGGHYAIVVSDPGVVDEKSLPVLAGRISVTPTPTAAAAFP